MKTRARSEETRIVEQVVIYISTLVKMHLFMWNFVRKELFDIIIELLRSSFLFEVKEYFFSKTFTNPSKHVFRRWDFPR